MRRHASAAVEYPPEGALCVPTALPIAQDCYTNVAHHAGGNNIPASNVPCYRDELCAACLN
eukprot:2823293-Pyramimonas_sp.AAC.1